ncbi:MAG: helix-turn-helix domain-containing protein [Deltaproteobacteria bacterium]|nr:helix-turn-helix domain-containing protein [Deltaproteobacteria bacterium]MBN2673620.1 helix-turn-helix domain-containing protein [Deltaproteobacteria bacterium]
MQVILDADALGKRVREKRTEIKITQAELAGMCGVGVCFVSDLERGKASCELDKALTVVNRSGLRILMAAKRELPVNFKEGSAK